MTSSAETKTTQTFKVKLETVSPLPNAAHPSWQQPEMREFTIQAHPAGSLFVSVGPLDPNHFKDGDEVKVIVQRCGRPRRERT